MKLSIYSVIIVSILLGSAGCVSHTARENNYLPPGGKMNALNVQKILDFSLIEDDFTYCKKNENMIENWAYEWNFHIPKKDMIDFLLDFNQKVTALEARYPGNVEVLLLQMLLTSYLYNLDSCDTMKLVAEKHTMIRKINPVEYRAGWFYGSFQCRAGESEQGIRFLLSIIHDNKEEEISPYFWKDFSYCASISGMPSHVLMSSDKIMKYFGELTFLEKHIKTASEKLLVVPEDNTEIDAEELWIYKKIEGYVMATNRLSGLAIILKDEWKFQPFNYQKGMSGATIQPEIEITEEGEIGYNFLILAYNPYPDESLAAFIKQFLDIETYTTYTIEEIVLKPALLKNAIAYFGTSELIYPHAGGGRMILCGIEREEPLYPGLALEQPLQMPGVDADGETQYFQVNEMYRRLPGKMFYVLIVDTCGLIYDKSLETFESFIENNLIIE